MLSTLKKIARTSYSIIKNGDAFHNDDNKAAAFLKKHPMPSLTSIEKEEIDDYWRRFWILQTKRLLVDVKSSLIVMPISMAESFLTI
ncbi:MAG: hypothetical protein IIT94_01765, partial [Prevotella sp.]|nr:hypothetical protein [Prevotella sp.]